MARTTKPKAKAAPKTAAVALDEPGIDDDEAQDSPADRNRAIWLRGLAMLIFAVLFYIAQWVLFLATVLQFFWMLFAGERNKPIAEFGDGLSKWLAGTARFQSGASEDKPFPWSRWGA